MSNEHLRKLKSEAHRAKAKDREDNNANIHSHREENNIIHSHSNADPVALLALGVSPSDVEAVIRSAGHCLNYLVIMAIITTSIMDISSYHLIYYHFTMSKDQMNLLEIPRLE